MKGSWTEGGPKAAGTNGKGGGYKNSGRGGGGGGGGGRNAAAAVALDPEVLKAALPTNEQDFHLYWSATRDFKAKVLAMQEATGVRVSDVM